MSKKVSKPGNDANGSLQVDLVYLTYITLSRYGTYTPSPTHTHTPSPTHTLTHHPLTLTHSSQLVPHILTHLTLPHTHTYTHPHTLTHSHSHSHSPTHPHTPSLTHPHQLTHSHIITHPHSHTLTNSHTHTSTPTPRSWFQYGTSWMNLAQEFNTQTTPVLP